MSDYYTGETLLIIDQAGRYEVQIGVRDPVSSESAGDLYTNGLRAAAALAELADSPFLQGVADGCQQVLSERFRRAPAVVGNVVTSRLPTFIPAKLPLGDEEE